MLLLAEEGMQAMVNDRESEESTAKESGELPGRGWATRFTGQIRYRRFTDIDAGGRPAIFFKFEMDPGQSKLPQEVYDILNELKHLKPSPGHGLSSPRSSLTFNRSKKHGRVWRLNDDPTGRLASDILVAKLSDLAERIDKEPGPSR